MTNTNEVVVEVVPVVSKQFTEMMDKVTQAHSNLTPEDSLSLATMIQPDSDPQVINVSPAVAAELIIKHNGNNRSLSVLRVNGYASDMSRGEWMQNHQGIAFYGNGQVADGQHRLCAIAVSGVAQTLLVSNGFTKEAIDTIDRSTRRSAGESLEMNGVVHGKVKARIMKSALSYEAKLVDGSTRFSDIQLETAVHSNNDMLDDALRMGEASVENVTEPCLSKTEAQSLSFLMLHGGWSSSQTSGFISSVQTGIASYPEAPTVYLSRIFTKAKYAERRKDKLTSIGKLALALKGANYWAGGLSVAKVVWNPKKEELPSNIAPAIEESDAA